MDEIPDIKRDFNTSKMCRSCLLETEDEMNEIFGFCRGQEEISINQILINLASVQVNKNQNNVYLHKFFNITDLHLPKSFASALF